MPLDGRLNEREELILQAVVQCYITTAEPVGSRVLVKRFGLELSPATVRNVMADLEESGYLQQLHTSSGRAPTDRGYRYYVNYLMRVQELTIAERARIENELSRKLNDADEVLRQTSQMLALVTHQTGLVKTPDENCGQVKHIEVMLFSPTRAAVLVADNLGRVHTTIATLDQALESDELLRLNRFLNENLLETALDQMALKIQSASQTMMDEHRRLAEQALCLLNVLPAGRPRRLYLEGAARLFEQPEFQDVEKAREVFGLLDEQERLVSLLRSNALGGPTPGLSVLIGSESSEPGMKEMSVVTSPYRVGDQSVGMVGILGPRRMQYSRLTAIVDYTADILSRFLTRLAR